MWELQINFYKRFSRHESVPLNLCFKRTDKHVNIKPSKYNFRWKKILTMTYYTYIYILSLYLEYNWWIPPVTFFLEIIKIFMLCFKNHFEFWILNYSFQGNKISTFLWHLIYVLSIFIDYIYFYIYAISYTKYLKW